MSDDDLGRGDFGRRILHRRNELALSTAAVAEAANMAQNYLEYLERAPAPNVGNAVVDKLAYALQTTPGALLGAGFDEPPGQGSPGRSPVLSHIEVDECWQLLGGGGVGRLLFIDGGGGPSALPVNFAVVDHQIVFRTDPDSAMDRAGDVVIRIGFEVDHIDDAERTGWSVLLKGTLHLVVEETELEIMRTAEVAPWADGVRDQYLSIEADEVSGRRIEVYR
jgi:nitroimidazol reductase NimA-like FMN-containing flavoprotein (pyridoxamine 5'-phosphate oxidase superfamily)